MLIQNTRDTYSIIIIRNECTKGTRKWWETRQWYAVIVSLLLLLQQPYTIWFWRYSNSITLFIIFNACNNKNPTEWLALRKLFNADVAISHESFFELCESWRIKRRRFRERDRERNTNKIFAFMKTNWTNNRINWLHAFAIILIISCEMANHLVWLVKQTNKQRSKCNKSRLIEQHAGHIINID